MAARVSALVTVAVLLGGVLFVPGPWVAVAFCVAAACTLAVEYLEHETTRRSLVSDEAAREVKGTREEVAKVGAELERLTNRVVAIENRTGRASGR